VREAFPSQAKLTIVTAVIDKLRPWEELVRDDLSRENFTDFVRNTSPESMAVSSTPTTPRITKHTHRFLVSLRFA
jgi:hypothetical protein